MRWEVASIDFTLVQACVKMKPPQKGRVSWTTQQVKEGVNICVGAPHVKEGKSGWQSLENVGQVDLGF
jgi:hypothetical protein